MKKLITLFCCILLFSRIVNAQVATTISGTGNWSTPTQWSAGLPVATSNVTASAGTSTVDGNYTINNLTINSDAALTIAAGKTLTITGKLTLGSDNNGTASLINNGTLTVAGTTTVERYMVGNKWYIISPTAAGATVSAFLSENGNVPTNSSNLRGMRDYNTTTNIWNPYYISGAGTGNMIAGKGYTARITSTDHVAFIGALTFGNIDVPVTRTGDNGWNCIGNPYPSAININTASDATNNFLTINSSNLDPSYAAIYVWNETGVNDGNQNYYNVISNASFTIPKTALGQNRVQVGQGFFVKAKTTPSIVSFTPAMQAHQTNLPLKSSNASWPALELTVKTDSLSAFTDVAFNSKMTLGLDPSYDAGLIRSSTKLAVYSHLVTDNNVDFAIQCLPQDQIKNMVIPVGIDYAHGGELRLSAQSNALPIGTNIILEDRLNKSFTILSDGTEYNVFVEPGTKGIGRFYLHTTALSISELKNVMTTGKLSAFANLNKEIRISGDVSGKAFATLYDLLGKVIIQANLKEGNLNVIPASSLKTGIYMLSVRDYNKSQSFKLLIRE